MPMNNLIRKLKTGFTQVTNDVLNNPNLSLKAKGLYAYIYSKPDGWNFCYRRIAKDSKDGPRATLAAIQELEQHGYVRRFRLGSGRVEYQILVTPETQNRARAIQGAISAQCENRSELKQRT